MMDDARSSAAAAIYSYSSILSTLSLGEQFLPNVSIFPLKTTAALPGLKDRALPRGSGSS